MSNTVTIRELLVSLGVKADSKSVVKFDRGLQKVKQSMGQVVTAGVRLTAGLAAAGAAALYAATSTARHGDEVAKAADRVGLAVEEYQELQFAMERSGISAQGMEIAMKDLTRRSAEAAKGTGQAAEAYRDLGIQLRDDDGKIKAAPTLLEEIADALQGVESEAEKVRLVGYLSGEEAGVRLLPLLRDGSAGIKQLRREARLLGGVLDADAAAASEEFTDRMTDVKAIVGGLKAQIGLALLPTLTDMLEAFRDWYMANSGLIRQRIDRWGGRVTRFIRDDLMPAFRAADGVVRRFVGGWGTLIGGFTALGALLVGGRFLGVFSALSSAIGGVWLMVSGLLGALTGLAGGPLAALVVAFFVAAAATIAQVVAQATALALALEDVYTFFSGGDSVLGRFLAAMAPNIDALDEFRQLWTEVQRTGSAAFGVLEALAGLIGIDLREALAIAAYYATMLFHEIREAAGIAVFERIASQVRAALTVIQLLTRGVGALADRLEEIAAMIRSGDLSFLADGAMSALGPAAAVAGIAGRLAPAAAQGATEVARSFRGGDTTINNYGGSDGVVAGVQRAQDEQTRLASRALGR